jgi:3-oxoacyl-[acyl-carrier-protein] synthase III
MTNQAAVSSTALRSAWRTVSRSPTAPVLRISLLASYTIDPLVPYLGMALHDAGIPVRPQVGPFDQILRQCLDSTGETARSEPDVLLVAPRFEELGSDASRWTADLLDIADAAVATVGRWSRALLFVLPALPEGGEFGAGEAARPAGLAARATLAREAVREKLEGLAGVLVADAEDGLREVGRGRAHHPVMFRLGKVPYTEELFAHLGRQLGRVLGMHYGAVRRAVVFDVDSLPAGAEALRGCVRELRGVGMRIGLRASGDPADLWATLAAECPELVRFAEASAVDQHPVGEQVSALATALGVPAETAVLVTANPALAAAGVLLGEEPESWAGALRAGGLFDRPAPPAVVAPAPVTPAERPAPPTSLSLGDFLASLDVVVDFLPATEHLDKVAEAVERAKDFTLGNPHSAEDIAARAAEVLAISVRDRFGDHGVSGAVALSRADGLCTVDLFSLSCPVLGKQVEDAVLREIVRRAGGADVVFRYRETEHNQVAVAFLHAMASRSPAGDSRLHALTWSQPAPRSTPEPAGPPVDFGIVAFGHSLPESSAVDSAAAEYTDELHLVQGWGYRRFHRAPADAGLTDFAVAAGARALAEAGVDAKDVDLVVLAIADLAEYLYWDPAAATQGRLGALNAEAVLVNQACGGGVAAFDVVAGKLAVHPEYRTALLIGANRVCEPYWNRMKVNTSIYSDGAAAAVVRRDHGSCRWLTTEVITDGNYADFMRMNIGGAARPFLAGEPEQPAVGDPKDRLEDFFQGDVRKMYEFVSMTRARGREVVDLACARAGLSRQDIRKVIHFNDNVRQLTDLAKDLGIALADTNVESALDHGHLGCADQLLTLPRLLAAGELAAGDLVALTSTSSGMHWICTLLRV